MEMDKRTCSKSLTSEDREGPYLKLVPQNISFISTNGTCIKKYSKTGMQHLLDMLINSLKREKNKWYVIHRKTWVVGEEITGYTNIKP